MGKPLHVEWPCQGEAAPCLQPPADAGPQGQFQPGTQQ